MKVNDCQNRKWYIRPGWLLFWYVAALIVIWTVQCSLTQTVLPLDAIETIVWGEQGQWGNLKHPPLSGWVGYLFAAASGYADWSLYFAAELCLACGVWYVYRLGKEFFSEYEAAAAALLLYTLHYYNPSTLKFCSHFCEIALLPAMAYYFYVGIKNNRMTDWILLGVMSAMACLAKYSAVQLFPVFLIWMLMTPERRARFRAWGPYVSGIVFLLLMTPHIFWLFQNDFGPILHLQERMDKQEAWYFPLLAVATALYPLATEAIFLFGSILPWRKSCEKIPLQREVFRYSLLLTAIPSAIYLGISFCGEGIILMWFSYLASWTGMLVVSVSPWKVNAGVFKRLYIAVIILTLIMLVIMTVDILFKTRQKCHTIPADVIRQVEKYYATKSREKIAVVYGDRWIAGVVENYASCRPAACVAGDIINLNLVREKIRRHGMLLITDEPEAIDYLFKTLKIQVPMDGYAEFISKAPFGKEKVNAYRMGYIPPGMIQ